MRRQSYSEGEGDLMYKNFSEFWEANYPLESEDVIRRIALTAWNAATEGLTMDIFSNSEIYTEAVIRGFEVRRTDESVEESNEK